MECINHPYKYKIPLDTFVEINPRDDIEKTDGEHALNLCSIIL
jgi:hypothetical protein